MVYIEIALDQLSEAINKKKRINLTTENQNQIQCYVPTNN